MYSSTIRVKEYTVLHYECVVVVHFASMRTYYTVLRRECSNVLLWEGSTLFFNNESVVHLFHWECSTLFLDKNVVHCSSKRVLYTYMQWERCTLYTVLQWERSSLFFYKVVVHRWCPLLLPLDGAFGKGDPVKQKKLSIEMTSIILIYIISFLMISYYFGKQVLRGVRREVTIVWCLQLHCIQK